MSWQSVSLEDGRRALRRIRPSALVAPSWRAVTLPAALGGRPAPASPPKADDTPAARWRVGSAAAATSRAFRPLAIRCERCGGGVELRNWEAAALCATCRPLVLDAITVYDRANGIGAIPANLLMRYGADLAAAA